VEERELIQEAAAGDGTAQRALYEQHVGRVYRLAFRMAGQRDLAEDIVQDVFVKAFEKLGEFEGRSRLSTWLHSITVTVSLNTLRKVRRIQEREPVIEDLAEIAPGREDRDATLRIAIHRAIDTLGEGMRTVFVLHDLEGFTHAEIAAALSVEEGTSKARLSRARAKLREVLGERDQSTPLGRSEGGRA
jgi:RNA polymerase sigma-70 factor (ECF subfamily)